MRLLLLVFCCLAGIAALATPTTLIWIPSTDVQPYQVLHFDADMLLYTNGGATGAEADLGFLYGALPRLELGIDFVNNFFNAEGTSTNPIWFNGKVQIIGTNTSTFALSAGVENVAVQAPANAEMWYGVASYRFGKVRVTGGGYSGLRSVLGSDHTGFLFGLEYVPNNPKWWYATDYQSGRNPFGTWNIGTAYHFTDKISYIIGMDFYNAPEIVGAKSSITGQLDVDF